MIGETAGDEIANEDRSSLQLPHDLRTCSIPPIAEIIRSASSSVSSGTLRLDPIGNRTNRIEFAARGVLLIRSAVWLTIFVVHGWKLDAVRVRVRSLPYSSIELFDPTKTELNLCTP